MKKLILVISTLLLFTLSSYSYAGALSVFSADVENYDEIENDVENKINKPVDNSKVDYSITNKSGSETMKVNTSTSTNIKIVLKKEFDEKIEQIENQINKLKSLPAGGGDVGVNNTDLVNRLNKIENYLKNNYTCIKVFNGSGSGYFGTGGGRSTKTICGIGLVDRSKWEPKLEFK